MNYYLHAMSERRRANLKRIGVEIKPKQNLIITPEKAIRINDLTSRHKLDKLLASLRRQHREKLARQLKERQLSLL